MPIFAVFQKTRSLLWASVNTFDDNVEVESKKRLGVNQVVTVYYAQTVHLVNSSLFLCLFIFFLFCLLSSSLSPFSSSYPSNPFSFPFLTSGSWFNNILMRLELLFNRHVSVGLGKEKASFLCWFQSPRFLPSTTEWPLGTPWVLGSTTSLPDMNYVSHSPTFLSWSIFQTLTQTAYLQRQFHRSSTRKALKPQWHLKSKQSLQVSKNWNGIRRLSPISSG